MSLNDTHTLRPMAKRAAVKKPALDFGGETLGQRLTRLRKQHGFTQVELAEKVGITQVLISAYETGRAYFSVEMAVRFALVLEISLDELLHPKARKTSGKKPSRRVLRRLEQIERLPHRKQVALLTTIDAFLQNADSKAF
jgi:transcriptional regulator with XRE-family HTH domain